MSRQRGFTLIETLVALVVAAIAASVILAMVRGLMQRAEQEQRQIAEAIGVLNDSSLHSAFYPYTRAREQREPDWIFLTPDSPELPPVLVRNFAAREEKVMPPLAVAFTPFQAYTVQRGRQGIVRLAPALPSEGATIPGLPGAASASESGSRAP